MSRSRLYTVVLQSDVLSLLAELINEDIVLARDVESLERDLSFSPQSAGILKNSGYCVSRRGAVEIKYQVSDDDRLVKIIGIRRCAHPYDVVLSLSVRDRLNSASGTGEADLAVDTLGHWIPNLRRDPRLVGHRLEGNLYQDLLGRVTIQFEINEPNCRVMIVSIVVR